MRKNPLINKGEQTKIPFSFAEKPPSSFSLFFFYSRVKVLLQQLQITCLASNVVQGPGLLQRQSFISQPSGIIRAPFHLSWQRGERGKKNERQKLVKKTWQRGALSKLLKCLAIRHKWRANFTEKKMQIKERNIIIYTFLKLVAIYLYTACMENISYLILLLLIITFMLLLLLSSRSSSLLSR